VADGFMRARICFFQAPNNRSMLLAAPRSRSGAAGGMLATARLTGQTVGAILAAIPFRIAGHSETVALATGAALAGIAAIASAARLYHPEGKRPPKPAIVPTLPSAGLSGTRRDTQCSIP
jgi:hypothetical protein